MEKNNKIFKKKKGNLFLIKNFWVLKIKKEMLKFLVVAIVISFTNSCCNKSETCKITMVLATEGEVSISLTGYDVKIDWGDGTPKEKGKSIITFNHSYNDASIKTITIDGVGIEYLHCDGIGLINLEVKSNKLKWLSCQDNHLTSLDINGATALETLWCYKNQLTELNVSNNHFLEMLICNNNQLTELDLSNNKLLSSLVCYDNQLTVLDVSNNSHLSALWIRIINWRK